MNGMRGQLIKLLRETNPKAALDDEQHYDRPLHEIGIDSLDMMAVLFALQEQYGVAIPDEDVDRLTTVNAMTAYLERVRRDTAGE